MGDPMSEQGCHNCSKLGGCLEHSRGSIWCTRWERYNPFADKLREALPKDKKFSLDRLIDDHWGYNESFMRLLKHNNYTKEDIIALCKFVYTSSAYHFWKHCCEHYGIEEKSDE